MFHILQLKEDENTILFGVCANWSSRTTKISYNSADSTAITLIPKASFIDGTCKKMNPKQASLMAPVRKWTWHLQQETTKFPPFKSGLIEPEETIIKGEEGNRLVFICNSKL